MEEASVLHSGALYLIQIFGITLNSFNCSPLSSGSIHIPWTSQSLSRECEALSAAARQPPDQPQARVSRSSFRL